MSTSTPSFVEGLSAPLHGFRTIMSSMALLKYAIIPFVIYLVLFAAGLYYSPGLVSLMTGWFEPWMGEGFFYEMIGGLITVMAWIVYVIVLIYSIFLIARIIAAPFHGFLAEKILRDQGTLTEGPQGLRAWSRFTLKMTLITIAESFVFLLIGIVLFLFSFVPGVNILASFAALMILAFDSADYSFETLGFGLKKRFSFFFSHLWFFAGLATVMGISLLIPIANMILFPASVAGSAMAMGKLLPKD